jgi:hypothetical protein
LIYELCQIEVSLHERCAAAAELSTPSKSAFFKVRFYIYAVREQRILFDAAECHMLMAFAFDQTVNSLKKTSWFNA